MLPFLYKLDAYFRKTNEAKLLYSVTPAIGAFNNRDYKNVIIAGPTQSGKSTICNTVIGTPAAKVSPLAGFTTYPQGFANYEFNDSTRFFLNTARCDPNNKKPINCYSLKRAEFGNTYPGRVIIWDTPDFDSIAAGTYKLPLLELTGMADIIVAVLSKEKYADEEVWEFLNIAARLKTPLIIALNKVHANDREAIINAFSSHLATTQYQPNIIKILTLGAISGQDGECPELVGLIKENIVSPFVSNAYSYIKSFWHDWSIPLKHEFALLKNWRQMVEDEYAGIIANYKSDYLDNPHKYASFKCAVEKCLELIEIPGLKALGKIRNIIGIPAKYIMQAFGKTGKTSRFDFANETAVLSLIIESAWIKLENSLRSRMDENPGGWGCILHQTQTLRESNLHTLDRHIKQYQQEFIPEIDKTANLLYAKLTENPALLNSMRAARASVDVLAVAVALKTAGMSLTSLILAPAMLAVSTKLTEGALGAYIKSQAQKLAHKQRKILDEKLIKPYFVTPLLTLSCDDGSSGISEDEFKYITKILDER